MLKNLIRLLVSLSLISNLSYAETTNNLVSQDFTTGWSGTNLSSMHGSTTIAGVHNRYVESDAVSLNSLDINKESINNGLTITGEAEVWTWYGDTNQSVTQTIKAIDDNGNTVTQTKVMPFSGSGFVKSTDQLIIGSNSQQDYNVSLRYDFSIPNHPTYHYAADLKNPYLSVTYTYVPPMDAATQTALLDLNKTVTETLDASILTKEFKQEIGINYENSLTGEIYGTEPPTDTMSIDNTTEIKSSEPQTETQSYQDSSSTDSKELSDGKTDAPVSQAEDSQKESLQESKTEEAEPSSSQAEQSSDEGSDKESQTSTEEKQTEQAATDSNDKQASDEKKTVSLAESMNKIDAQVKDIGKNLELKNVVKINAMVDNSALQAYENVEFYKTKDIYTDQINIRDNRILYSNTSLVSYMQKDPVFIKQNEIYNIRLQKQKLIRELQVLKNG